MLDLGFVRANLPLVEEKLRARGADPAALLGDFHSLDQRRREAITQSESLKARRNELSQQVGQIKRTGGDATALMDETRALKEQLDALEQAPAPGQFDPGQAGPARHQHHAVAGGRRAERGQLLRR